MRKAQSRPSSPPGIPYSLESFEDESERQAFQPGIVILGQVTLVSSATWRLILTSPILLEAAQKEIPRSLLVNNPDGVRTSE